MKITVHGDILRGLANTIEPELIIKESFLAMYNEVVDANKVGDIFSVDIKINFVEDNDRAADDIDSLLKRIELLEKDRTELLSKLSTYEFAQIRDQEQSNG